MSAGVPVVATQGSGLSEVVTDGETGFLRPMGDIDALAEASLTILNSPELAAKMREAGRARAEKCFQAKSITKQYLKLYNAVLSEQAFPQPAPCA